MATLRRELGKIAGCKGTVPFFMARGQRAKTMINEFAKNKTNTTYTCVRIPGYYITGMLKKANGFLNITYKIIIFSFHTPVKYSFRYIFNLCYMSRDERADKMINEFLEKESQRVIIRTYVGMLCFSGAKTWLQNHGVILGFVVCWLFCSLKFPHPFSANEFLMKTTFVLGFGISL